MGDDHMVPRLHFDTAETDNNMFHLPLGQLLGIIFSFEYLRPVFSNGLTNSHDVQASAGNSDICLRCAGYPSTFVVRNAQQ